MSALLKQSGEVFIVKKKIFFNNWSDWTDICRISDQSDQFGQNPINPINPMAHPRISDDPFILIRMEPSRDHPADGLIRFIRIAPLGSVQSETLNQNILRSSDYRKTNFSSLDSSHRDESNGNCFVSLGAIDDEINRV